MARIRSVHPGLFTDEAFMSASPMARLLMIGLWTESWDDGAFEWKPVVIKARIFPADTCDAAALLDELCSLGAVKRVERNGKSYGLVRNFRKFQKPKKPNSSGITTAEDVDFLGPDYTSSEPVPNQFRTSAEKPIQMEDGGGRREEKKEEPSSLHSDGVSPAPEKSPSRKAKTTTTRCTLSNRDADRALGETQDEFEAFEASGLPMADYDAIRDKFEDHHNSRGNLMADWVAAWRTWLRNEVEFRRRGQTSRPFDRNPISVRH